MTLKELIELIPQGHRVSLYRSDVIKAVLITVENEECRRCEYVALRNDDMLNMIAERTIRDLIADATTPPAGPAD